MTQPDLSPASQKLLRELARRDTGDGVPVRYASRGRSYLASVSSSGALFTTRTLRPLYDAGLATGWDEHDDGPMHITDAGRKLAAELDAHAKAQQAAKKARPTPSADGPAARRLLREIAKHEEPVPVYSDSKGPRVWRLDGRDGYGASVDTWSALRRAGLIDVEQRFAGGLRVTVTDAGRKRLASPAV